METTRTPRQQICLRELSRLVAYLAIGSLMVACAPDAELKPLKVFVEGRSMSKLAVVIAKDQGLYEKYGLDVEFEMSDPEFEAGKIPHAPLLTRISRRLGLKEYPPIEIRVTGQTPTIYYQTTMATRAKQIALASTDCSVRYYVVAKPGIDRIEDIKGKRIGVNALRTTSAFAALRLIERQGWDRQFDVSVFEDGRGIENIERGQVDVIVGGDELFEAATREGYTILEDTRYWNEDLAGNSILVETGWLERGDNRDTARRFLQGVLEGLAIFHQQPELALDVAMRWYGFPDREMARGRLERADYVPRKPYPCYEGIKNTMRIHDSHEMRQYEPKDFYDDTLLRELDQSGFIDALYTNLH